MNRDPGASGFAFEADVYATLELMPLAVRRQLDVARVKLSLAGWQALPIAARRLLATLRDDAFAARLRLESVRAQLDLPALPESATPPGWLLVTPPTEVSTAVAAAGGSIDDAAWRRLDDDARFALDHLSRSNRQAHRLPALLAELGLARRTD